MDLRVDHRAVYSRLHLLVLLHQAVDKCEEEEEVVVCLLEE